VQWPYDTVKTNSPAVKPVIFLQLQQMEMHKGIPGEDLLHKAIISQSERQDSNRIP